MANTLFGDNAWLVFGSSTIDSSTRDSSITRYFALQLLIASHKQLRGVLGGGAPQF